MAGWHSILLQQKPSKAISRDTGRPEIGKGHIRHDGSYLYCTDSYILARIPINMGCPPEDRASVLPEMGIGREALEALDGHSRFRFSSGLLEIEGCSARWPVEIAAKSPNFKDLMKYTAAALRERKEAALQEKLVFNPDNLQRLSQALGLGQPMGLAAVLEAVSPVRAITVTPLSSECGIGLLMPVRHAS
jgi:hypothetical protein